MGALPDNALAGILRLLPPRSLAVSRCVCKAWLAIIDARALLLPHLLPHSIRGIFLNYVDYHRPHHFTRPSSTSPLFPKVVDGMLDFLPVETIEGVCDCWWVLDHCNGLLLCDFPRIMRRDLCVCNPATRRWTLLPHQNTLVINY
ncbi:hypothetical protein PR202_ga30289 [Eleusine coracana subsp. coracana]|uniref:F-box domain-containing protein n=1 Tax=Eleusine coracana subsp. coracana TaxID=191504 RepID=A0AAV5DNH1_ELECO|nr:hypothetical protein PR202_ga30289 [Eleusine coracana subsp. coracana]